MGIPATHFDGESRYLGVTVGNDAEMMPRKQVASVPYSYWAEEAGNADTVDGVDASDLVTASPDFDSGWFTMQSQAGTNSFKEISHNLGDYPSRVKVLVKAIDGNNNGFIFEGMGAAQADDDPDTGHYGGFIFAYNQTAVRIWAPDQENQNALGAIINVVDGWGGEVNIQRSHTAEVRVLVWR